LDNQLVWQTNYCTKNCCR